MKEVSGQEEVHNAPKREVQQKNIQFVCKCQLQSWKIQRIFQLDSRYKPAGMTGEEYGSGKSGVCFSPLIRILNKKRPSDCRNNDLSNLQIPPPSHTGCFLKEIVIAKK